MTDLKPKITAIAAWYGGKRTMAPRIAEALGKHTAYWEPFCGSMAVLMSKPPCRSETVSDLHGDLINLARVVRDPQFGPKLYRALRRTLIHEGLFAEAAMVISSCEAFGLGAPGKACNVERAYYFFIATWLGRNGVAGTKQGGAGNFCVRYTANGGDPSTRFRSAIASIPAWRKRLENVTILCRDGFELLERIDDVEGTAIYCDPPYLVKGAEYIHDFAPEDHQRLATALARFRRARVVVSYYAHPKLAALYPGWRTIECDVTKALGQEAKRDKSGATKAPEVLLVNQRATAQEPMPLFGGGM